MKDTAQHPDDFANAFDSAFAHLQVRVETACLTGEVWPQKATAAIRAALAFAAAEPAAANVLTNGALAEGKAGFARYDRMLDHFAVGLLPGRAERPEGERLPEVTEKAMIGGLATLISQRLAFDRQAELPMIAAEAIQFVLTPYLGAEDARLLGGEVG
jgi:hypothetical protein